MGVFGAVFGCRGDVGFKGPLLGASRGVVGFNVTTLLRLVREKVRPAWLDVCVSAKKFALCAHNGSKLAFSGVLGEVFRGRAAGGAVLGEFFRGPAVVGVAAGPSTGSVDPSMRSYTLWVAWWAARPGHHPSG